MSEKYSENQPILVPRSGDKATRRVEVWHLTSDVDVVSGRSIARSQSPEANRGSYGYVEKPLSNKTLSLEGQAELAEELAQGMIMKKELGGTALEGFGVEQPEDDNAVDQLRLIPGMMAEVERSRPEEAPAPEVVKDKLDSLSVQDRRDVLQYRMLSDNQRQAHKEKDFLRSKDLKEAAYYLYKKMSTAAQDAIHN